MDYDGLARSALANYGAVTGNCTAAFIRHNENAVWMATDRATGQRYLLRIHEPVTRNLRGVQHTFEGLVSEIRIIDGFREGLGLPMQRCVPDPDGALVTVAFDPSDGLGHLCTLMTWVDGTILADTPDDDGNHGPYRSLARLMASMHTHSMRNPVTKPLVRPVYDAAKYTNLIDGLGLGVTLGLFGKDDYETIKRTMGVIDRFMAGYACTPDKWGIIHGDMSPGNAVVHNGTTVPIDFGFSGYGHYLFDLGGALPALESNQALAMLGEYDSMLPIDDDGFRLMDCSFLLGILGCFGFMVTNPAKQEWISRRVPRVAGDQCRRLMDGLPVAPRIRPH